MLDAFSAFLVFLGMDIFRYFADGDLQNLCGNGDFESIGADEFPIMWSGFAQEGAFFGISTDAHTGKFSLRLKSTSTSVVGVNRARDALIPIRRGIVSFWYKAVSSGVGGRNLQVCIIAMNRSATNEVDRVTYTVPAEHVADGKWHFVKIKFDFGSRNEASYIHFAPRINETTDKAPGELLIDDVIISPLGLVIESFGVNKPCFKTGEKINVSLSVRNETESTLRDISGSIVLPKGLGFQDVEGYEFIIEELAPGESKTLKWDLMAKTPLVDVLKVNIGPASQTSALLVIADRLERECSLKNRYGFQISFYKTEHGYGFFQLEDLSNGSVTPVAFANMLSLVIYQGESQEEVYLPLFADNLKLYEHSCVFSKRFDDLEGATWDVKFKFELSPEQRYADVEYSLSVDRDRKLLAFYGPVLYSDSSKRYDAVFPGLEFLEAGELSSSTLDVAPPNNLRRVPHPNKITIPIMAVSDRLKDGTSITGIMWSKDPKLNPIELSAMFAMPNRFEGMDSYDMMGVFLPSVPDWVKENEIKSSVPYVIKPGHLVKINAQIFGISSPESELSSVHSIPLMWVEKYGLPEPLPLPRGSLQEELIFSLNAYMKTLWVPEKQGWHQTLDWDPWGVNVNPEFLGQLWLSGKMLERKDYLERAEPLLNKIGDNHGLELAFYNGNLLKAYYRYKAMIAGIISSQQDDGSWRFDPVHLNATDTIHHQDYNKLGKKGDVEVGICANRAYLLLNYAMMTGDEGVKSAGLKALEFMKRFKIPRAAQVWEIPVHTPDVLASAHATLAFLEGYKLTGKEEYLKLAIYWAYTGLPFIYLWNREDMKCMLYASIPVFGATWFTGSWFGVAVQWNGLEYARSLFELSKYDKSFAWEKVAQGLTISALYQEETSERYKGLYPDSYNFIDKTSSSWKLSPALLIRNLFIMMKYPYSPEIELVKFGEKVIRIVSLVQPTEIEVTEGSIGFSIGHPSNIDCYIMIFGLEEPKSVKDKARELPRIEELSISKEGWFYEQKEGLLLVKVQGGSNRIEVE